MLFIEVHTDLCIQKCAVSRLSLITKCLRKKIKKTLTLTLALEQNSEPNGPLNIFLKNIILPRCQDALMFKLSISSSSLVINGGCGCSGVLGRGLDRAGSRVANRPILGGKT